jgi:hypothetical protein
MHSYLSYFLNVSIGGIQALVISRNKYACVKSAAFDSSLVLTPSLVTEAL